MSGESGPRAYPDLKALCRAELGPVSVLYVTPFLDPDDPNPYMRLLYRPLAGDAESRLRPLRPHQALLPFLRRIVRRERSAWHQHWLQFSSLPTFLRALHRLAGTALYVAAGGRVLWTVHNERPHVDRYVALNRLASACLARLAFRVHVHHAEAARVARESLGIPPGRIVLLPHPAYDTAPIPAAEARRGLRERYGVDAGGKALFLMFGGIARYKGIDEAIDAFAEAGRADALLLVAGAVRGNEADHGADLRRRAAGVPGVILLDRHVPEEDVNLFFCAADRVVFNHRRGLTSGAMQLASDYRCRMLVPDVEAASAFAGPGMERFSGREGLVALMRAVPAPGANWPT